MLFETHGNNLFHNRHGAREAKIVSSEWARRALAAPRQRGAAGSPGGGSGRQSSDRQHHLPPLPGTQPIERGRPRPQHRTEPRPAAEVTLRGEKASPGWSCSSSQPSRQEPGAHGRRSLSCGGTTAALCSMKRSPKMLRNC